MIKRLNVRRSTRSNLLFALVGLLLTLMIIMPVYILIISSFKPLKEIYIHVLGWPAAEVFTLENYPAAMEGLEFEVTFFNSVLISAGTALLVVLCNAMTAWVLVRYKSRASRILFFLFALSMLVPFQCIMLPLTRQLTALNLNNRLGLILAYLGLNSSMSIVLYHGFIKGIPLDIEESAIIDGASMVQLFCSIIFPLLRTMSITVGILSILNTWNDFLLPSLLVNRTGMRTLPLKTFLFVSQFVKRWDLATAGLVLGMVPILVFYLFCQKYIIKGVTEGALKG